MISTISTNPKFQNLVVSTGNILNVSNKLGIKSDEELLDGLALTLQCSKSVNHVDLDETNGQVLRATQELKSKLTENERPDISIGAKIFLNKSGVDSGACVEQAVNALLQILQVQHVDNVVLAYHPKVKNTDGAAASTDTISWSSRSVEATEELKLLWASLENFAQKKQITQLGISDLDIDTLSELHATARVPPTIAQINLASCCVVPPRVQEFCNKNDIQLLTHSDPEVLLSDEEFIVPGYAVDWTLRYQVHLRCRGILTTKGYILGASKLHAEEKTA